jgi:hypothetical protein
MAKNIKVLQAKMPAAAQARSQAQADQMIQEMALDELREALDLTQEHLAEPAHVHQAAISKLARRSDMVQGERHEKAIASGSRQGTAR